MSIDKNALEDLVRKHVNVEAFSLTKINVEPRFNHEKFRVILEADGALPALVHAEPLATALQGECTRINESKERTFDDDGFYRSDRPERLEFEGTFQDTQLKLAIRCRDNPQPASE